MQIAYYSLTGNVKRFLQKCNVKGINILENETIDEPFIMVTGTIGFGEVPKPVSNFLKNNSDFLKGVISSGNRNWGANFAKSGDIIADQYKVPLLMKIELHGNNNDINLFKERMNQFDKLKSS